MKRRSRCIPVILAAMILVCACQSGNKERGRSPGASGFPAKGKVELKVDPQKSMVKWKGEMLGLYSHFGIVDIRSGSLTLSSGGITAGRFVVDMRTIRPTDENYSQDRPRENLVAHLESADFFDVENHPEASFVITSAGARSISGTMTIRGVSRPETFTDVSVSRKDDTWQITAQARIDRKKYGAAFDLTVPNMVLGKDILLNIEILAEPEAS